VSKIGSMSEPRRQTKLPRIESYVASKDAPKSLAAAIGLVNLPGAALSKQQPANHGLARRSQRSDNRTTQFADADKVAQKGLAIQRRILREAATR
jgi:hypothetical protein